MAGSLNHIVDDEFGTFTMGTIENMGDAHEALHECFEIIRVLTKGKARKVNRVCRKLHFPEIEHDMVKSGLDWVTAYWGGNR